MADYPSQRSNIVAIERGDNAWSVEKLFVADRQTSFHTRRANAAAERYVRSNGFEIVGKWDQTTAGTQTRTLLDEAPRQIRLAPALAALPRCGPQRLEPIVPRLLPQLQGR